MSGAFAAVCIALVAGCASSGNDVGTTPRTVETVVSVTTLAKDAQRVYLEALQDGVTFEAQNGCLYVGDHQTVWFFGTTVRPKTGTAEFEVFDADERKLAETGTTVRWGGGEVSASEAAKYTFNEKLVISPTCAEKGDAYWLVGRIEKPLFSSSNAQA